MYTVVVAKGAGMPEQATDPLQPVQQAPAIDLMTYEPPGINESLQQVAQSMTPQQGVQSTQPVAGQSAVPIRPNVPIYSPGNGGG
jgi:hypothetical protein